VFVVRALGSFSDVASDAQMPFYLMRTLGGSHVLRGFRDFRFRDRHTSRRRPSIASRSSALDGAVFYEAGQVAPRLDNFQWREFERTGASGSASAATAVSSSPGSLRRRGPRTWLRFGHVF
jgi:hypothetical protein